MFGKTRVRGEGSSLTIREHLDQIVVVEFVGRAAIAAIGDADRLGEILLGHQHVAVRGARPIGGGVALLIGDFHQPGWQCRQLQARCEKQQRLFCVFGCQPTQTDKAVHPPRVNFALTSILAAASSASSEI
jgi:hypothetical protein